MSGKEKFAYLWRICFLVLFAFIACFSGVYTIVKFPFNLLILFFTVIMGGAAVACARFAMLLGKEFKKKKTEDTEGAE